MSCSHESPSILHTLYLQHIFSNAHIGLILLDEQASIVSISTAAAKILGGTPEHFEGQNIFHLFKNLPEDRQLISKRVFEGVTVQNQAMIWYNGQSYYELLVDSFPLIDAEGQQQGAYIFIKDVTNIRSLENQIHRSERLAMIGQMAAGTAHEIRNPLTSIRGFLQILNKTLAEHNMTREVEYTNIMLDEIDRINQLVGEFLLLSKSRETRMEKIYLDELIKQFLPIVENEALLYGIEVKTESFANLPPVLGDKELLKQVFLNICKNAIEAMGNKGQLSLSSQLLREEQMIRIDIMDTGPGIPPYVIDKIFEPFFTTKEEGTGLGLSICQRIIHDMGGKIRVSSKGYGTTFHVCIPYLDA
ncbi:signal transduction histidine kinase, nitrogen specific, NtrB [Caldalkalibacillus thermarum TA2.A1]|uniref:histidine kinase n=1 Tax=Caldalkalibacillus thermarum (strain TA2.A1) TaxID=986075 RepID=F5L9W1_CALTT|nr:ATP-binding protein [Caldalkalibacillus thermarum]EGL81831.1 signal transduction histidine kinase, nitrogen specific, NtrB [Caldalkalibacillus thermarum TA2.A1]QZT34321.1 PAS domain S-box protein [Caldalkalibacillus thermarum TA2.A1]